MKHLIRVLPILFLFTLFSNTLLKSQTPNEQALWPDGIPNNPVVYEKEKVRGEKVSESSLSQQNRVFSQVSKPSYIFYQAEKEIATGVAMVICPGGGFRDVWFDREGADFALWLAQRGITSLVLKYRTFNKDAENFSLVRDVYNTEVYADVKQAIHILRSQAKELGIDKSKIGIAGFSAGGALSLFAALEIYESTLPDYAKFDHSTLPDFVCLIYPGVRDGFYTAIEQKEHIPPMFLVNGAEDDVTPANKCIRLYSALMEKNVPAELHIYAKGRHGFDSGIGRGYGIATWQNSFINWLKDMKFLD